MTHDYNAHLLSLSGLLSQGQLSQAEDYLQQLIHQQTDQILPSTPTTPPWMRC